MPANDEDESPPEGLDALSDALARDPSLLAELELILPALDPAARRAFGQALVAAGLDQRPAALVLEALVAAARAAPGQRCRRRA
jgi:hypothetical protein